MNGMPYNESIKEKRENYLKTLSLLPPLESNSIIKEYQDANGFYVTFSENLYLKSFIGGDQYGTNIN